ncbi:MAG: type II secretion system minor pseudopilin GspI [Polaromonas sp.]|uniref:type II secretion system minor pseudopilin GspI n=1 Tax=Polaromonas sp. TaxID=1869339 RepID=UPI002732C523|nr:type II secretion system minor pseudopilin GspI [Polaromonas sp.]MDP2818746.1 type II secretion system minor pseudopilin GspI [Polaromonas sp.]
MKPARLRPTPTSEWGFTLIEVLVALAIVAISLVAGLQATTALTNNALRQSDVLLAHLCAENELIKLRLLQQMPGVGDNTSRCEQAGRGLQVTLSVRPTPNPKFRRVDALINDGNAPVLRLSAVVTHD